MILGNSFRGHSFECVTRLLVSDERPFEHDFFYWIANAFPKLKCLVVFNVEPQERKPFNDKFPLSRCPLCTYRLY
jgi:hypothetical protein